MCSKFDIQFLMLGEMDMGRIVFWTKSLCMERTNDQSERHGQLIHDYDGEIKLVWTKNKQTNLEKNMSL